MSLSPTPGPGNFPPCVAGGIRRAVVPAAGFGTRLRPLTNALPKEMLPVGRKPVLEHVVDELRAAGITDILFVVSPRKEMIRQYFGDGSEFGLHCDYVLQPEMKGLGDAVLRAESWVGSAPFLVAFGDCLITIRADGSAGTESAVSPLGRMLSTHIILDSSATVLTERIPKDRTKRYGIVAPKNENDAGRNEPFILRSIVEKPDPDSAPSCHAVAARWALNPGIFQFLRESPPGPDEEFNLTDPVRAMMAAGAPAWAVPLMPGEARQDIGGWETYLRAVASAAANDMDFGPAIRAMICGSGSGNGEKA